MGEAQASGERWAEPDYHIRSPSTLSRAAGFPEGSRVRPGGRQWAGNPLPPPRRESLLNAWYTWGWGARRG